MASEDLVIATPEMVTFQYAVAGPGSRFLAQIVDHVILLVAIVIAVIAAGAIGSLTADARWGTAVGLLLVYVLVFGYFILLEAIWNGQTPGKRIFQLRVVADAGEPPRLHQIVIRNLVRIVDYLPVFYGVGLVTMFIQGRGKRLGDLAAGTVVVIERRGRVNLSQLTGSSAAVADSATVSLPPISSIWDQASEAKPVAAARPGGEEAVAAQTLHPDLRRFVVAYAVRRYELTAERRQQLAASVEPALRRALPQVVAERGAQAALDQLADGEGGALLPPHPSAGKAFGLGIAALVTSVACAPVGVVLMLTGLFFAFRALRAIRIEPGRYAGVEDARRARLMCIIAAAVCVLWVGVALLVRNASSS